MLKDLKLAQEAAGSVGAATSLGAEAAQLYAVFVAAGHGGDDFSGMINFLRGIGGSTQKNERLFMGLHESLHKSERKTPFPPRCRYFIKL